MVCDGDGLVTEGDGLLHDIGDIRNPVGIRHLRVAVEFYPLLGGKVLPLGPEIRNLLQPVDPGEGEFPGLHVLLDHAPEAEEFPRHHFFGELGKALLVRKNLRGNGVRSVVEGEDVEDLVAVSKLDRVHFHNLPPDDGLLHLLLNILDFNQVSVRITSENHIRVVAAGPPETAFPAEAALPAAERAFSPLEAALSPLEAAFLTLESFLLLSSPGRRLPHCGNCIPVGPFLGLVGFSHSF